VLVTNTLARMLEHQPGVEAAFMAAPEGTVAFYRRVLTLVTARDAERARALTRRLIERLDRQVLASLRLLLSPEATP
jgi:DNA-binding FadR family transcriptional regulator